MTHNWDPNMAKQLPLPGLEAYLVKDAHFDFSVETISADNANELMELVLSWCTDRGYNVGGGFTMVAGTEEFGDEKWEADDV